MRWLMILFISICLVGCASSNVPNMPTPQPALEPTLPPTLAPTTELVPEPTATSDHLFSLLDGVTTAEEEAAAFTAIWEQADRLGFAALDEAGETLSLSETNWWDDLHTLRLRVDDRTLNYIIIDPENVFILMQE